MGAADVAPFRWPKGISGNPAGRPLGARAKLSELVASWLHEDFKEHGRETIARVRERQPDMYLRAVVSLLPKRTEKLETPFHDLSDDELRQLEELLAALRAKTVAQLKPPQPSRSTPSGKLRTKHHSSQLPHQVPSSPLFDDVVDDSATLTAQQKTQMGNDPARKMPSALAGEAQEGASAAPSPPSMQD